MSHSFRTSQLLRWLERMRAGDRAAGDELFRHLGGRLKRLAGKMLRGFPAVRRWTGSDDVLQNATLRLLRAMQEVSPDSTAKFFGLATKAIRRELLDLKRHYCGPQGMGAHHQTDGPDRPAREPVDPAPGPDELEEWCEFHAQVERLPAEERAVVDLHFYQGLSKAEAAELLGVDIRTVQRRWNAALQRLRPPRRGAGTGP
jgi:RNA polymerase sigma-70 factor (ECF subfamily)